MEKIKDLLKSAEISDDEIISVVRTLRFGSTLRCIYCGSNMVIRWGYIPHSYKQRYLCKKCGATFNDLTGTPLENSKISPREWLLIAYLFLNYGKKASEIAKITHHSTRTIYRVINTIKENSFLRDLVKKLGLHINNVLENCDHGTSH